MSYWRTNLKWLHPGMHVKRWIVLGFVGLLIFVVGLAVITQAHAGSDTLVIRVAKWTSHHVSLGLRPGILGVVLTLVGLVVLLFAFGRLIASLTGVLDPELGAGGLVNAVYQQRRLSQGKRIVVIGGGTGLSTMLRGLKRYSSNITAIVTVADDGGSSGKIQKQLGILPPGDIRNCLVALADSELQMTELFQYRFRNKDGGAKPENKAGRENGGSIEVAASVPAASSSGEAGYGEGLRDHAFGNLLIAAMTAINGGDFERAIQETSEILNIRGRVLPSTVEHVRLCGEMRDGSCIEGETAIAHSSLGIRRVSLIPERPRPVEDALEAIEQADIIVLGPGSVFTSVIPNLLVEGLPKAIHRSRAKKVYACNVMTQPGETDNFTAFDHVEAIEMHAGLKCFSYVLVNTGQPDPQLLEKYRKTGAVLVEPDTDRIKKGGYRPITGNFINQTDVVRHNAVTLAEAIMKL